MNSRLSACSVSVVGAGVSGSVEVSFNTSCQSDTVLPDWPGRYLTALETSLFEE